MNRAIGKKCVETGKEYNKKNEGRKLYEKVEGGKKGNGWGNGREETE